MIGIICRISMFAIRITKHPLPLRMVACWQGHSHPSNSNWCRHGLVQAWVELHRDDLFADWELAVNGEEPFRIAPLQ